MTVENNDNLQSWERQALHQLLKDTLQEQRRARRWRIFFRLSFLLLFILMIFILWPSDGKGADHKPHTALVELNGELMDDSDANAKDINKALNKAYKDPQTKAVMLEINSPGGSPVQAGEIYSNIMRLKKAHPDIKIYAVCTDSCASGAYYVAAAADYIYSDPASLVGSIGVLMDGFGFTDTLTKLGVQRRLMTSGSEKGFLDPFSPVKPTDEAYMQTMLDIIHQQFINAVKTGRGNKLKNDPLLFSGLVWTGQQALELGLVDGLATPDQVTRDIIKVPHTVDYTDSGSFFDHLTGRIGVTAAHSVAAMLGIQASNLH